MIFFFLLDLELEWRVRRLKGILKLKLRCIAGLRRLLGNGN